MNPRKFDFHIHVETDDATPAHALERLRELGLDAGLVDHVFKDRNRITPVEVKMKCRKEFFDVSFMHGCEADAYDNGAIAVKESQLENIDFVLISFTHIGQPGVLDDVSHEDSKTMATRLLILLEAAVNCPYVGGIVHPFAMDLSSEVTENIYNALDLSCLGRILCKAESLGVPFEINARTLRRLPTYPQAKFIDAAFRCGCNFTIGSDAHCLEEIGHTAEAWELIKELGISENRICKPRLIKDIQTSDSNEF